MTVSVLVEKMRDYLGESARSAHSNRYMKAKIEEYFAENIIITNINGKPNVTFRKTAASILEEFHNSKKTMLIQGKGSRMDIITNATKLIRRALNLLKHPTRTIL